MGPKIRAISFQSNKPMMNLKEDSPVFIDSHTDHVGFSNKIWRTKALEILMITLRFISFITKSNFATSFKLINKNVFEIIGDVSADFTYYLLKNFFKYEKPTGFQKGQHFLNQTLLIPLRKTKLLKIYCGNQKLIMRPESLASIWWNIYILTILNINVLYVSIKIAFKFDEQSQDDFYQARQIIFDVLPSYSFMLEILLKFNTCYYYKGAVIENRYQIAKNYLRSSFFFDIFVVIPYFISLRFDLQYLDLVIILKVFQITKFSRNLFDRLELTAIQIVIVDLVKLGYTILAAAHFSACIWFLVGSTGNPNDTSWIKAQNIENEQWFNQYLHSLYWSIITMTTIGYGDITPQNLRERVFAVGMALSAVGVFGYSIGNINSIYAEWSRQSFQIRTDMNNLKKFIRIKGINKHLAEKIRKYFEYVWSDQMEDNDREVYKFSEMIPKQLAEEMKIDTNMKLIQKNSFLVNNFSEQFLISLSKVLIEEKYVPESTIYLVKLINILQQNDPSNYLYILSNGSLSFYITLNNKQQTIKVLETIKNEGQAFGVLEFFQSQAYQVSCKSNQFSYVLKIDKSQFMEIISQHKNDYVTQIIYLILVQIL
uniref:K+ channel n=1 Tax=Paramecium tetraurelia TaxID=5888 RepID=Q27170_PARTE|nr:K+ channel [Paramecium tetraurelia]AAL27464.1 K+-channel Pak2 [Paramecium tetraurelia]